VSHRKPGEADIEREFFSEQNEYFVLHDSKGFEPGDNAAFDTVSQFINKRSKKDRVEDQVPLKDQIHAIW